MLPQTQVQKHFESVAPKQMLRPTFIAGSSLIPPEMGRIIFGDQRISFFNGNIFAGRRLVRQTGKMLSPYDLCGEILRTGCGCEFGREGEVHIFDFGVHLFHD